jgi:hypothetical protein
MIIDATVVEECQSYVCFGVTEELRRLIIVIGLSSVGSFVRGEEKL